MAKKAVPTLCLRLPTATRACSVCAPPVNERPRADFNEWPTGANGCSLQPLPSWWVNSEVQVLHWITERPTAHSGNLIDNTLLIDVLPFPVSLPPSLLKFLRFTSQMNPHTQIFPCLGACVLTAKTTTLIYFWKKNSLNKDDMRTWYLLKCKEIRNEMWTSFIF